MSRRLPRVPARWRANSSGRTAERDDLRAPLAAPAARRAAAVVVVAVRAAQSARGRNDERRPAGDGPQRAFWDCAPAAVAALALSRGLDYRSRRSATWLGARRAAQRGDFDRACGGRLEEHARGGFLATQSTGCRAAHGCGVCARPRL